MRFAVGLLTHRVIDFDRVELLEQTVRSIERAFPSATLYAFDNGSSDGTWDVLRETCGRENASRWLMCNRVGDDSAVPGAGRNALVRIMSVGDDIVAFAEEDQIRWGRSVHSVPEIIVLSDDDMVWHEGAEDQLARFFAAAPEDVVLVTGFVEPDFPHATPREAVEYGGVRGVMRDNAPGCAWAFRPSFWREYGPIPEILIGCDSRTCDRVKSDGKRMVALRLADHAGLGRSSLGNSLGKMFPPLDGAKWGV